MRHNRYHGITVVQLLALLLFVLVLALAIPRIFITRCVITKVSSAQNAMKRFAMGLQRYHEAFHTYPPDNSPSTNGSEILCHYLCRPPGVNSEFGPFVETDGECPNGKVLSPLGGDYYYVRLLSLLNQPRGYLMIDPGLDKELGGRLDPQKGFIVEDAAKAADNLLGEEKE